MQMTQTHVCILYDHHDMAYGMAYLHTPSGMAYRMAYYACTACRTVHATMHMHVQRSYMQSVHNNC